MNILYDLKTTFQDKPSGETLATTSRLTKLYMSQWEQIVAVQGILYRFWVEYVANLQLVSDWTACIVERRYTCGS